MKIILPLLFFLLCLTATAQKKSARRPPPKPPRKIVVVDKPPQLQRASINVSAEKATDVIARAEKLYLEGVNYLAEGKKQAAFQSFSSATSAVMNANVSPEEQPAIAEFYEKLSNSIYLVKTGRKPPPKSAAEVSKTNIIDPGKPKKPIPSTKKTSSVSLETATTPDGRIIALKSDGTWGFTGINEKKVETAPAPAAEVADAPQIPMPRPVERPLYPSDYDPSYRSRYDPKPKATTSTLHISGNGGVLVLSKSLLSILKEANVQPVEKSASTYEGNLLLTLISAANKPKKDRYKPFLGSVMPLLQKYAVKGVQKNSYGGTMPIEQLPFGEYFIFGAWKDFSGVYVWDMPVTVDDQDEYIDLNYANAAYH